MLADNVTCNRNLADLMQIPHIGCYSHRLNLWVKCYTEQYEPLLGAVNDLMLKLRTLKGAAALQKAYDDGEYKYVALHRNKTRWSSTFNMLQRFLKIRSVIERMREKDIEDLLLKINELENICIPCTNLYKMYVFSCFCCYNLCYYRLSPIDQVTVGLQGRTISVYQAQQLVNFVTQVHSDQLDLNNEYLNVGCNILRSKSFFTGVMKVYEGRENQLSFLEKNALRAFKKPIQQASIEDELEVDPNSSNIVADIIAKTNSSLGKHRAVSNESSYYDLDFIPGTSCEVERLFSISRHILTYNRSSMTPTQFERVIFLKMNKRFWDATLVSKIVSLRKNHAANSHDNDAAVDENARNVDADPAAEDSYYDQDLQCSEENDLMSDDIAYDPASNANDPELGPEFHQDEHPENIMINHLDENIYNRQLHVSQGQVNNDPESDHDVLLDHLDDAIPAVNEVDPIVSEPEHNQHIELDLIQLRRNQSSLRTFERTGSYIAREANSLAKDPRFNAAAVQPMHNVRQVKTNPRYASANLQ